MDEHAERMGPAYPAVTYGDLDPLCADLPAAGPVIARPRAAPHAAAPPAAAGRRDVLAGVPTVLQALWTIWLTAVAIDVLVRGLGQWHQWPPGPPVAAWGGRSVQGHAAGGVSWRHPDPAPPALRRAAHARHSFIGSISEPDVVTAQGLRKTPGTLVLHGKAATSATVRSSAPLARSGAKYQHTEHPVLRGKPPASRQ